MKKRIAALLALVTIITVILPACSSKRDTVSLKVGTRVHNGMYNSMYAVTAEDRDVCDLIYERLTKADDNGVYVVNDRIVESFATSSDGTSYTFVIKEGVKFANGKPLTSDDIIFTYQTIADKSSTAINKGKVLLLEGITAYMQGTTTDFTAVQAMNDRTIMFNFIKNDPTNMEACGGAILSREYYPDWEVGNTDLAMHQKMRTPMGSGPYVINDISNDGIVLNRNPAYWAKDDTNYLIDTIEIKYYSDALLPEAFASGEVDFAPEIANRDALMKLKGLGEVGDGETLDFILYDTDKYAYIGFNTKAAYSKSWTIRRAVGYGFNRDAFVKSYFADYAKRVDTQIPSDIGLYKQISPMIDHYDYDPEKARELLAGVNYMWDDDGNMTFDGDKVTMTFYGDISHPTSEAIAEQLKTDMAALGIKVNIENYDSVELGEKLRDDESEWNIFFAEDIWNIEDKYSFVNRYRLVDNADANLTGYNDALIEALMLQISSMPNINEDIEKDVYGEILLNVNKYLPELPIYTRKNASVISSKVSGIEVGRYSSWTKSVEGATLKGMEVKE